MLAALSDLYLRGGWLMAAISVGGLALYALLIASWRSVRGEPAKTPSSQYSRAAASLALVRALIAALPLLGLLGTVSGVALSMGGIAQAGLSAESTALGVGQALITTQYALLLALPAILPERLLMRRLRVFELSNALEGRG